MDNFAALGWGLFRIGVLGAMEQNTGLSRMATHQRPLSRLVLLNCAAAVVRPDSRILGL